MKYIPVFGRDIESIRKSLNSRTHLIETFEREDGRALLKKWGITGNYIGVGNCILGYAAEPDKAPAPRKDDYITIIK